MFQSPYEAIGGEQVVSKLVDAFYERVAKHPDLAPIFPNDLTETARKQKQFLTQYLGGLRYIQPNTDTRCCAPVICRFQLHQRAQKHGLRVCMKRWMRSD